MIPSPAVGRRFCPEDERETVGGTLRWHGGVVWRRCRFADDCTAESTELSLRCASKISRWPRLCDVLPGRAELAAASEPPLRIPRR